jgi:flagellar biosynthesis chaperone FliJ
VDASAFTNGEDAVSFFKNNACRLARFVLVGEKTLNAPVMERIFKKKAVTAMEYSEDLLRQYKDHLVASGQIPADTVIDSKESLKKALLMQPTPKAAPAPVQKNASLDVKTAEIDLGQRVAKNEDMNNKIIEANGVRMDLEMKKLPELENKYKAAIEQLKELEGHFQEMRDLFAEKWGEGIFSLAIESTNAFLEKLNEVKEALKEVNAATPESAKGTGPFQQEPALWRGGMARSVFARVSAGEGFIPPGLVRNNLSALNALNSGTVMPSAKGFPIGRLSGPGGVDNIHTMLPRGSFVVSKRGMAAYDKAVTDRERFALGGLTGGSDGSVMQPQGMDEEFSMFELTINTQQGASTHQLYGPKETILTLKKQLEKENLTKLR